MKLKRSYKAKVLVILSMFAMIFCTACTTTRIMARSPPIDFPIFPSVDGVKFDEATNTVLVPLQCWVKITEYAVDVDTIHKTIDEWQKIDEGE